MFTFTASCGHRTILVAFVFGLSSASCNGDLMLSLQQTTDISSLGIINVGGMAFDASDDRLWLTDAGDDTVFEIDPFTGSVMSTIDATVIPGFSGGPDAIALQPGTGDLYLFDTFGSPTYGVVSQSGAYVRPLGGLPDAGGAAFSNAGELFVVDQNDAFVRQLDPITGFAIAPDISLIGFSGRLGAAAFDPVSGNLFAYASDDVSLLEIDLVTGNILSTTDLTAFIPFQGFPAGMAFDGTGDHLFLSNHSTNELVILRTTAVPEPSHLLVFAAATGLCWCRKSRWGRNLPMSRWLNQVI